MAKDGLHRIFSRIVKIKPDELKISFLLFFYLFLVIAAYNVIKPIRNASLLEELGYQYLPVVYLLTAVIIGFVVAIHSKIQVKISRYALITLSILFFFLTCLIFRIFSGYGWQGLPIIFWVWANVFIIVLNTQFWITVNDVLNPREFKRLSGFFISGGILGGFVGGLLAGSLAKENVEYNLLFLSAGLLFVCSLLVYWIFRWQKREQSVQDKEEKSGDVKAGTTTKPGFRDSYKSVKEHNYLRFIATIVILTLVVSTLIDFQFQTVVQNNETGNLTSFFGYFYAGLMVFAFLLSLLMTSKLFRRYGVRISLLLYPLVLLLCFFGIGIAASLVMAIVIKGSDKSLSYSINRSARELLFIPVSPDIKYKAIVFIDMFVDRFSKGLGAVVLLIIMSFGIQDYKGLVRVVSLVSIVMILGWIVFTVRASREYVNSVKKKLPPPAPRPDKLVEVGLDVDYTKLIFDTLESRERSPDLYAMHVFELMKRGKLTPELRQLLSVQAEDMAPSSLGTFFEADSSAFIRMDDVDNNDVMGKEIQEIMSLDVYENVMKEYIDKVLSDKSSNAETARMEIAKGIGFLTLDSPIIQKLEELLVDDSSEVRKYAIESAAKLRKREYVPVLIQSLQDPPTHSDAAAALEKYGLRILGSLADYLCDSDEDLELRKAVVSILAHIGTQEAADYMLWELDENNEEMDSELIDALDRIRSEMPEIEFYEDLIKKKIKQKLKSYYEQFVEFADKESKGKDEEICRVMSYELTNSLMNIFKLLGLIYPHEDVAKALQNIQTGTKKDVAYAVELLDNILEKEIRAAILPIVEDLSQVERAKACAALRKDFPEF
ncbi:MAG: MFS transporter [Candidatus Aminicenantes bacterium]|nr:MAG: MFS transporter [Candidatus Aminicenantes bacterium]